LNGFIIPVKGIPGALTIANPSMDCCWKFWLTPERLDQHRFCRHHCRESKCLAIVELSRVPPVSFFIADLNVNALLVQWPLHLALGHAPALDDLPLTGLKTR
jgi:hypothetical protein